MIIYSKSDEKGKNTRFVGPDTYKKYAYSNDYKLAVNVPNESLIDEPYAVFIDQYFCHHIDFISHQIIHSFTAEQYYSVLNKFLVDFSRKTGLKIVIASHPRREEVFLGDFDPLFKIYFNQTPQLVKNCKVVLQHFSTAVSYAVIYKKPFLFLYSELFDNGTIDHKMQEFATFFKKDYTILEEEFTYNEAELYSINKDTHETYLNAFLRHKKSSQFQSFTEIIVEYINNHHSA